jgi:hypothetical protein
VPAHATAEEVLAIDDRPVDFAGRNELTRIVNGPRLEGETPADGRGRLGDDLDGAAHSGRASVLDAHRCADGIPSAPRWRTCANSRTARRCSPCSPRPRTST